MREFIYRSSVATSVHSSDLLQLSLLSYEELFFPKVFCEQHGVIELQATYVIGARDLLLSEVSVNFK